MTTMTTFTAGRFTAECFVGPQNGGGTKITLDYNGVASDSFKMKKNDLIDLWYVLGRALDAHDLKSRVLK